MKPAAFDYVRPVSINEALTYLQASGDARIIAGGQSLAPMLNMRLATPARLVDINDLTELAYIREGDAWVEVGALTRHYQMAESARLQRACPLLADAAATIGHYAIRQRGTLGGSLAHADPAAQLVLVAMTLDARLSLARNGAQREVPAQDFFTGAMSTTLAPDEMIASVRFPRAAPREGAGYARFSRRHGDYALVAVAATVTLDGTRVSHMRLGLGGLGPVPLCMEQLAQRCCGQVPDADWVRGVADLARDTVTPDDDGRLAPAYLKELTHVLVGNALQQALARCQA